MKKHFYTVELKNGNVAFIYKDIIVNTLWDNFFPEVGMKDEYRCSELFLKKYGKKLDEIDNLYRELI
jgi:hypothetical protein